MSMKFFRSGFRTKRGAMLLASFLVVGIVGFSRTLVASISSSATSISASGGFSASVDRTVFVIDSNTVDTDGDGIVDILDMDPVSFSDEFETDTPEGDYIYGNIFRGDLHVSVANAANINDGVLIRVSGNENSTLAFIEVCNEVEPALLLSNADEFLLVSCNDDSTTVKVLNGEVNILLDPTSSSQIKVPAGQLVTYNTETRILTTDAGNTSNITIIYAGTELLLEPGISLSVNFAIDTDGDNIMNSVDQEPETSSENFTDGTTYGTIISSGDLDLLVRDATDTSEGIVLYTTDRGEDRGDTQARVKVCGASTITMTDGDEVMVTCGSVILDVLAGEVEAELVAVNNSVSTVSVPAENGITFYPLDNSFSATQENTEDVEIKLVAADSSISTVNLPAGNSVTFHYEENTISSAPENTDDITIVVGNDERRVAPGSTVTLKYRFDGFLQPINDTAHQVGQNVSVFKAGSTVPVKFQLKRADGTVVQATVEPIWSTPIKGSPMNSAVDEGVYTLAPTSGLTYRWDDASQQYIYNWSTKGLEAGYWYRISAGIDDGSTYTVTVGLR